MVAETVKNSTQPVRRVVAGHAGAAVGRSTVDWLETAVAIGAAGLAAVAADTALQAHAGLAPATAAAVAGVAFAVLVAAHASQNLRAARVAPALKPKAHRKSRTSRAAMPVSVGAALPPASLTEPSAVAMTDSQTLSDAGFEHLQTLVAELARLTPGPKATTPDPDAPTPHGPISPIDAAGYGRAAQTSALRQANAVMVHGLSTPAHVVQPVGDIAGAVAELSAALAADRMTVYLEPIQQIEFDRARHYEVSVRFKAEDGTELPHNDVLAVARDAGLLPRIDAAVLPRAARIAQHFQLRGRDTEILSRVHGVSLPDQDFRAEITAATIAADGAALVLSFAQDDVRSFGPIHWEILSTIADMGLRFAVEAVTDLDMDFESLKARGFNFIKLDADILLQGLPATGLVIAPGDVCQHFAGMGLALIVSHIDDDNALARILGFGVLFGQGALFGTPRAVRSDILTASLAA